VTLLAAAAGWLLAACVVAAGSTAWPALPVAVAFTVHLPAPSITKRVLHGVVAAMVVACSAGYLVAGLDAPPQDSVARLIGEERRLLVRVASDPDVHPTLTTVTATALAMQSDGSWLPASGRLQISLRGGTTVRAGDDVEWFGRIEQPGGARASVSYRRWLRRNGIVAGLYAPALLAVHHRPPSLIGGSWRSAQHLLEEGLTRTLPAREAALASALVLGNRHALPKDLSADLNDSGAAHVVTASAFKLLLLYGTLTALLAPFIGRRRATLTAMFAAVTLGLGLGQSPVLLRGEILVVLLTLATLSGRPYSSTGLLALAAAAMTVRDPLLLTDAGFQLTFAAAAGIAVIKPGLLNLQQRLMRLVDGVDRSPGLTAACDALLTGLAVTIAIVPVTLSAFGHLSIYAPAVNAVLNPALPAMTVLALRTGIAGATVPVLGSICAAPLWLALVGSELLVHIAATAPLAQVGMSITPLPFACAWYGVIALGPACFRVVGRSHWASPGTTSPPPRLRSVHARRRRPPALAALAPLIAAAVTVGGVRILNPAPSSGQETSITWLALSGRPAALIEGQSHLRVLVTDNAAAVSLSQALQRLPGSPRGVDSIIVTQSSNGVTPVAVWQEIARYLHAGAVLIPAAHAPGEPVGETVVPNETTMRSRSLQVVPVDGGVTVDLGGGDRAQMYTGLTSAPVVMVNLGGRSVLVTSTALAAQRTLAQWGPAPAIDVLALSYLDRARDDEDLAALHPAELLLTARDNTGLAATGIPAIALARTRDLRISAPKGQLRIRYRDP